MLRDWFVVSPTSRPRWVPKHHAASNSGRIRKGRVAARPRGTHFANQRSATTMFTGSTSAHPPVEDSEIPSTKRS